MEAVAEHSGVPHARLLNLFAGVALTGPRSNKVRDALAALSPKPPEPPPIPAVLKTRPLLRDVVAAMTPDYPIFDAVHGKIIDRCQAMTDYILTNKGNQHSRQPREFGSGIPNIGKSSIGYVWCCYNLGLDHNLRGFIFSEDVDMAAPKVDKCRRWIEGNEGFHRFFGDLRPIDDRSQGAKKRWREASFTITRDSIYEEPSLKALGRRNFDTTSQHFDFGFADDPHPGHASQKIKDRTWEVTKFIPARLERWGAFLGIANFWGGLDWAYRMTTEWAPILSNPPILIPLSDGALYNGKVRSLLPDFYTDDEATAIRERLMLSADGEYRWACEYCLNPNVSGDRIFNPGLWNDALVDVTPELLRELRCVIMAFDPRGIEHRGAGDGSEAALHAGGWRERGTWVSLEMRSSHWDDDAVDQNIAEMIVRWKPRWFGIEKVNFSSRLFRAVSTQLESLALHGHAVPQIVDLIHGGINKDERICAWTRDWNRGHVQINRALFDGSRPPELLASATRFKEQLMSFPRCAGNVKDALDAWAYLLRMTDDHLLAPRYSGYPSARGKTEMEEFIEAIRAGRGKEYKARRAARIGRGDQYAEMNA